MRLFRLALTATVVSLALAAPGGASADPECPGVYSPVDPLEPTVCAGTETDGWGGSMYAYAGTCVTGECTIVVVPVEDLVITVGAIVDDVYQKIRP